MSKIGFGNWLKLGLPKREGVNLLHRTKELFYRRN
jgi:hypothetical protein